VTSSGGVAAGPGAWVLLHYQLPRVPSTPRIALWRRLRRLGAAQLGDGLVTLPADARTVEQLEWLAQDVREASGTAGVWTARPTSLAQERELTTAMAAARAAEYVALAEEAEAARSGSDRERDKALVRLRRQWREITRRDFFPPAERDAADAALRDLASADLSVAHAEETP
jgi:hypothetical protein